MIGPFTRKKSVLVSALGAALTVFCGLILWGTSLGDLWTNTSYDYGFRFGARPVTNAVTLILMDNAAFDQFHQTRGEPWDRALHAQLLDRLADDGCALVVMDSFFRGTNNLEYDAALAAAMRRQRQIVLMAEQAQVTHPGLAGAQPTLPAELFLHAAKTSWGVAWLNPDLDTIVRRQWPFPSPGPYPSLPWTAARLAGAKLNEAPQERWLRYYGQDGGCTRMSYQYALTQPTNYFRDRIVFIGTEPKTSLPDGEPDKFPTPYTRWTGEASGGVEILLAEFLNLLNDDSLQRPPAWVELILLTVTGIFLGGGLWRLRVRNALMIAAGIFLGVAVSAVWLSYYSNCWFPWLIIAGGQVPCALAWTLVTGLRRAPVPAGTASSEPMPETPGYELFHPPFAGGAYGKVWLARNAAGQWRALKVIYLAKFEGDPDPYEREFAGVQKYQPISDRHPGLLRVDFVSEKKADFFYYVMELGDSVEPGWENQPALYKPRDLVSERARLRGRRLPVKECVRLGILLSEALDFLHRQGMTHRDIKPQNIIFVNGQPKLADLGLVTGIRPLGHRGTLVGTPGFMPPSPERPGTVAADIYSLGMVLYVVCTGRAAALFPEVATTLVSTGEPPEFLPLNSVILKACAPRPEERYASAAEMRAALEALPMAGE
ncbi:MAG TPA: serine/threonine-protein kinase [Verrucomicrobiae bacterium]|nr:serine/threonine-protein kinase [Verrucomicrobiae bacterium]